MDSITHILSAALVTEPIGAPAKSGPGYARWRERLVVLLAALAPDADGLLGFIDLALYAKYHRVVTHSVGGLLLISLFVAWVAKIYPQGWLLPSMRPAADLGAVEQPSLRRLYGFACISASCHFVGDWIAAWGIWPFWPFWQADLSLHRVNSLEIVLAIMTVSAWAVQHFLLRRALEKHGDKHPRPTVRKAWWVTVIWVILAAIYIWLRPHFGEAAFV